jgi:hypothetical protein
MNHEPAPTRNDNYFFNQIKVNLIFFLVSWLRIFQGAALKAAHVLARHTKPPKNMTTETPDPLTRENLETFVRAAFAPSTHHACIFSSKAIDTEWQGYEPN